MAREEIPCEIHMLAIPFPLQGHINPMVQFSKLMASRGIKVTLVISSTLINLLQHKTTSTICIESVPDALDELEKYEDKIEGFINAHKSSISRNLPKVVEKMEGEGNPVKVIAYDLLMPWVLELAHQLGAKGAALSTESCAVSAVFYHFQEQGGMQLPLEEGGTVEFPGLPPLGRDDLPATVSDTRSYPALVRLMSSQNQNFGKADWVLFNTFDVLEDEVVKWMKNQWPFRTIGPAIPLRYLDVKRLKDNDKEEDEEYGLSMFKPSDDKGWMKWLDSKEPGSVVYVSFGSLAEIKEEQMEETLMGLANTNFNFLWVVRDSEETKLPTNLRHQTQDRGLIVNWCSQLEVLAHKSVGCFVTHCGWNSVLEALNLGVPMVAIPIWADQPTNAKFIVDVWKVGVGVEFGENRVVKREEVERSVKEVMEGEKKIQLKENANRWKKLANDAVNGGSSHTNIEELVSEFCSLI